MIGYQGPIQKSPHQYSCLFQIEACLKHLNIIGHTVTNRVDTVIKFKQTALVIYSQPFSGDRLFILVQWLKGTRPDLRGQKTITVCFSEGGDEKSLAFY